MSYIPLVPYYTTKINTKLSIEEVRETLLSNIDPEFKRKGSMLYWGTVAQQDFSIFRYINGRNTYLPLIKGTFEPNGNGATIKVTIMLHPGVVIILISFLLLVILSFTQISKLAIGISITVAFIFHCVMYLWGFLPEQEKAEQWLRAVLKSSD